MAKISDTYESSSNWLKAEDIKGHKPIVTIESAEAKENTYNGETKKQIVLKFVGKDKLLGLNRTNASKIADLTGQDDSDDWVGTSIKLFVERVQFQDKMVDAIRVFPELPPQAKSVAVGQEPPMPPFVTPTDAEKPEGDSSDIPF